MKSSLRILLPALLVGALGCAHSTGTGTAGTGPRIPRRVPSLTSDDIARAPGVPIEQLLAARVPGIRLTRAADGRLVMLIRAGSTLSEPYEPLFVLDGVPLGSAANFSVVNRNDIESIEVLRDAASTALYGLQGAGGVILITTKGS